MFQTARISDHKLVIEVGKTNGLVHVMHLTKFSGFQLSDYVESFSEEQPGATIEGYTRGFGTRAYDYLEPWRDVNFIEADDPSQYLSINENKDSYSSNCSAYINSSLLLEYGTEMNLQYGYFLPEIMLFRRFTFRVRIIRVEVLKNNI